MTTHAPHPEQRSVPACVDPCHMPSTVQADEVLADAPLGEPGSRAGLAARLNWLRAGVLGANDGIISTAGLIVGVAAATTDRAAVLIAGVAALVAGAVSMALGEYVSVSSQRDTERALLARERRDLDADPDGELAELAEIYRRKGLRPRTAVLVARELTEADALGAHLEARFGIDPDELTNPWHAALASAVAFTLGALVPLLAVVAAPATARVPVTFVAVVVALVATGSVSASFARSGRLRPIVRLVGGGALAMAATWGIGSLLGVAVL